MKRLGSVLTALLFVGILSVSAQTNYTIQADQAFEAQLFAQAAELYKKASSKEKDRQIKEEITFRMAECYRMMGDWRKAAGYYNRAIKRRYPDPVAKLYYADMLKAQGEYDEAIVAYENYRQDAPSDPRGREGVESCKKALEWLETTSRYELENLRDFNTKENDFAPAWGDKDQTSIIFTSQREDGAGKDIDGWTDQGFMDLYETHEERKRRGGRRSRSGTEDEAPSWSVPAPLPDDINTKAHEGFASVNERGNMLFFTRCENLKNAGFLGCRIYMARKKGKTWGEPELVNINVDSLASIGHPFLLDDETMIVAADLGEEGGRDLYKLTYERRVRTWGTPENLGPQVNTVGFEGYPFVQGDYLYFTSDGHPGMGAWDIFRVKMNPDGTFGEVENMKSPINSNSDDFAIIFKGDEPEVGYMTSNRDGGHGGDDIYAVRLKPLLFALSGVVTDTKSGRTLDRVTVKLVGSDGAALETTTDKSGAYYFGADQLAEGVNYTLNFEAKDYLTKSGSVTTVGIPLSAFEETTDGFLHTLVMNKELDPIRKPIVLPKIEYDFNSAELRPEAMESLDGLVEVLEDNPNITIELRSHTDHIGSDPANQQLSQRRAQSCVDYLISKGIAEDRLIAVGMGENEPFVINESYEGPEYLKAGDRLTEAFIRRLQRDNGDEADEIARQLNRRTDFQVKSRNYVPKGQ